MQALCYDRYGPPDILLVRDIETPAPGCDEILIRVVALPVGPGDCKLRGGLLRHHFEIAFPKIPGRYGSGVIVDCGAGVNGWARGDGVVFASLHADAGTAAEYVVRKPDQIARKPAGISHTEAAAAIQGGTCAWICVVEAGRVQADDRILVHGAAGAVGSACVELARSRGAHVTATCRSSDVEFVRALGADEIHAFDRGPANSAGQAFDVAVDPIGGAVHAASYPLLRRGGRLVYLNAEPIIDLGAEFGVDVINARIDDRGQILANVCSLLETGVLRPRVGLVLPLDQAAEAHRRVEAGSVKRGRAVLSIG